MLYVYYVNVEMRRNRRSIFLEKWFARLLFVQGQSKVTIESFYLFFAFILTGFLTITAEPFAKKTE